MDTDQNSCVTVQQVQTLAANTRQVFTVGDAGRVVNRSASSIRRLAEELRIEPQRTASGVRIFNFEQVQKIAGELRRREMERERNR